ncbi:MAG: hypothetical protein ACK5CE_04145 [Actinomycetes bacterium]
MNDVSSQLNDVRNQIKTNDKVMAETRRRRDVTLAAAARFSGVRYSYRSGSVAMGVANTPVNDADGGIVLDRRVYPKLGPDGDGELPAGIVADLHDHLGPEVRKVWPSATVHDMKRGVTVKFHEPVLDDQDPYVDVVVAMERCEATGLWIPNLAQQRWDPSDPERHVELMLAGSDTTRRARARVVRLAKAWNCQFAQPALSSFNIVSLALECITTGVRIDIGLHQFFEHATSSLSRKLTEDPAKVSGPIKTALSKSIAVARLESARDSMSVALNSSDDDEVAAALHDVFWTFLPEPYKVESKSAIADLLRTTSPRVLAAPGGLSVIGHAKPYRSYGAKDA